MASAFVRPKPLQRRTHPPSPPALKEQILGYLGISFGYLVLRVFVTHVGLGVVSDPDGLEVLSGNEGNRVPL